MTIMANGGMPDYVTVATDTQSKRQNAFKRQWLQFSIRSLLIVTTLFAFILGMFMLRVRRQEEAVAKLRKLGGSVTYEANWLGHVLPESIVKLLGDDFCANVVSVNLSHRTINRRLVTPSKKELEQIIDAISQFPNITRLSMHTLNLQDEDLAKLAPLKNRIEELSINELFRGDMRGNKLEHLEGWTQLRSLEILSSGIDETLNLRPLASLPNLTHLSIGTGMLNETAFVYISKIDSLQILNLFSCRFDGSHLRHLQHLPNLNNLELQNIHAEPAYSLYTIGASGEIQPLGKTNFRFEQSTKYEDFEKRLKTFPADRYRQWLKEVLPKVNVSEFTSF